MRMKEIIANLSSPCQCWRKCLENNNCGENIHGDVKGVKKAKLSSVFFNDQELLWVWMIYCPLQSSDIRTISSFLKVVLYLELLQRRNTLEQKQTKYAAK